MGDRDSILDSMPQARGGERPRAIARVKTVPSGDLWKAFSVMVEFHKGEVASLGDLAGFRDRAVWDDDVDESVRDLLGTQSQVWDAECGVTLCDAAIAETGSLLLSAGPGKSRLASLAPPVHICLVRPGGVVASLDEGLARLTGRTAVLVTGPSRTADVEGVIVMGVHGPKRLIVVPLPR